MRDRRLYLVLGALGVVAAASYVLLVRPLGRDTQRASGERSVAVTRAADGTGPAIAATAGASKPALDCAHPAGNVATIDGTAITAERLCGWLGKLGARRPDGIDHVQARQVLDRMIDAVLVERALARAGIQVTDADVDALLGQLGATAPAGATTDPASAPDLLREQARERLELQKLAASRGDHRVTEAEVDRELAAGAPGIDRGQGVRVEGWVARVAPSADTAARMKAEKAAERFAAELGTAAPEKLASIHGLAHLPPFLLSDSGLEPELETAAFSIGRGEYTRAIETRTGWVVLRVLERVAGTKLDDAALRARVRRALETRKLQGTSKQVLGQLRSQAAIEVLVEL